jgi:DNA polymerase-3 subunit gamma/tau
MPGAGVWLARIPLLNKRKRTEPRMSYLVLARKWRPKTFDDVVGQAHVLRALKNALAADRVHHAYLFAGTRGVGKTTIARLLAKALNCREGVVTEPCGQCEACRALDEGRFVDLIEVDAASRTGVDDTRDLLENVQYTPTSGRYKVYLIDEVHMLSRQSFNALLKTLEEPPPHVKFLFATTDPQKLPITVLSRCLQFNLKSLPVSLIDQRMQQILQAEKLQAEPAALTRIARAAAGSLRDALSLLDQALAFGDNSLRDEDVAVMLGSMDRHRVIALLDCVASGDALELLARIRALDEDVPDYGRALEELATVLQRLALLQFAGTEALEDEEELVELERLAAALDPAQTQLYYQIAITSRRDLALAPDPRLGFEMAMLRMLAFRVNADRADSPRAVAAPQKPVAKSNKPIAGPVRTPTREASETKTGADKAAAPAPGRSKTDVPASPQEWTALVKALPVRGATRQLAENSALDSATPFELHLRVETRNQHLATEKLRDRLTTAVQEYLGTAVRVKFTLADEAGETLAKRAEQARATTLKQARETIDQDPNVRELVDLFGAEVVPDSVRPAGKSDTTS